MLDLTNEKYGRLTVLKEVDRDKNNKRQWECLCECGNRKIVRQNDLRTGKILSCGCLRNERIKQKNEERKENRKIIIPQDLTGQQFNYLTVLSFDREETLKHKPGEGNFWKCQCRCGNIIYLSTKKLKFGSVKSCGCLQKEISSKIMKEKVQPLGAKAREKDLSGQRFGKLLVLKKAEKDPNFARLSFICKCDCGNICVVKGQSLTSGSTNSCGCLKHHSLGELKIIEILERNNIKYRTEISFPDLIYKGKLRYDFAILDDKNNILKLIEYDGIQHFDKNNIWHNQDLEIRDKMKDEYAKKKNIPLLRISYKDKNNITFEQLMEGL